VLVWKNAAQRALHLLDGEALPLTLDDEVAVEVKLNRPAYPYLIWINTEGEAQPIYPWTAGKWDEPPAEEKPVDRLRRPSDQRDFWRLQQHFPGGGAVGMSIVLIKPRPGMETLLLLVREGPWPAGVDLRALLTGLPQPALQNSQAAVWFEDWEVVQGGPERGLNLFDVRRHEDPVLQTQRLLRERLGQYCSYSRAVSFANPNQ
jgi:hypothetical protein